MSLKRQRNEDGFDEAPKRRAISSTVDLNYPYAYQPANTTLNPPLIDPSGPLYDNGGKLTVAVADPIIIANKRIGLNYDASLIVNKKKIGVNVDTEGPIETTNDGLNIRTNNTLHVDEDWELGVKLDQTQPIDYTAAGLCINVDETLLIADNDAGDKKELGVHLNHNGPLNADSDGLDLDYDESLQVIPYNSVPKLGIRIDSESPFKVLPGGLSMKIDQNTLQITDGKLAVKSSGMSNITVDPRTMTSTTNEGTTTIGVKLARGVIVADSNGIKLLFDNNDFIDSEQLGLQTRTPISYLSPYCIYECGDKRLNTFTSQVRSNNNVNWECTYYVFMANSSGIVNASMMFLLDKQHINSMGTPPRTTTTFRATFVLNISGNPNTSHSQSNSDTPQLVPNTSATRQFFIPNNAITSVDCYELQPLYNANYYVRDPKGEVIQIYARGYEYNWKVSDVTIFPAKVTAVSPPPPPVIVLSFYGGLTDQNWYDSYRGSYFTGPFTFSYQGSIPDYSIN